MERSSQQGVETTVGPCSLPQVADIKHHAPSLTGIVSGGSTRAPSLCRRRTSVGGLLRVLAAPRQKLESPPQMIRPLRICQTGNLGRLEVGEGGRQSCPPPTPAAVSTPGRRQDHAFCSQGHVQPYLDTYSPLRTPLPHTYAETYFPNLHSPLVTDVAALSSGRMEEAIRMTR